MYVMCLVLVHTDILLLVGREPERREDNLRGRLINNNVNMVGMKQEREAGNLLKLETVVTSTCHDEATDPRGKVFAVPWIDYSTVPSSLEKRIDSLHRRMGM
jgi:hypothetical protein